MGQIQAGLQDLAAGWPHLLTQKHTLWSLPCDLCDTKLNANGIANRVAERLELFLTIHAVQGRVPFSRLGSCLHLTIAA